MILRGRVDRERGRGKGGGELRAGVGGCRKVGVFWGGVGGFC